MNKINHQLERQTTGQKIIEVASRWNEAERNVNTLNTKRRKELLNGVASIAASVIFDSREPERSHVFGITDSICNLVDTIETKEVMLKNARRLQSAKSLSDMVDSTTDNLARVWQDTKPIRQSLTAKASEVVLKANQFKDSVQETWENVKPITAALTCLASPFVLNQLIIESGTKLDISGLNAPAAIGLVAGIALSETIVSVGSAILAYDTNYKEPKYNYSYLAPSSLSYDNLGE